jgi:hypothetical protein
MSKPVTVAKKNGIRMFIIALTLMLMPLIGEFTPGAKALPAYGRHDYYSNPARTTQVGSVTLLCNGTICCSWGTTTGYRVYTPFNCNADPVR